METTSRHASHTQLTTAQVKSELAVLRQQYHDGAQTLPATNLRALSGTIRALQDELAARYSMGANVCPDCGAMPHGMERRMGLFQVGCLVCSPQIVQTDRGPMRQSAAAQGSSPEEAVSQWNAGKRLLEIIQQ